MAPMKNANAKAARKILDDIGETGEVARLLKVQPNVVTNWKARGIPKRYAERVAKLAKRPVAEVLPFCNACGQPL